MSTFEINKPVVSTTIAPIELPSIEDGYAAYLRREPEILAVDPGDVIRVAADVPRCCAIALGALPGIRSMRAKIVEVLPGHPVGAIDALEDYAFAAYYAHFMAAPPASDTTRVQRLQEEAAPLREHLLVQAGALAHVGLVDPARVADIRSGTGYIDLANDLIALSLIFRTTWSAVKNKTTVEQADCERAEQLGRELLVAVGARLQPSADTAVAEQTADRRARAFTVLVRAYESIRKAVSYLRWDEADADVLVPSLFMRARTKKAAPAVEPEPTNGATAPTVAAPVG